jgi:hypothetical protein
MPSESTSRHPSRPRKAGRSITHASEPDESLRTVFSGARKPISVVPKPPHPFSKTFFLLLSVQCLLGLGTKSSPCHGDAMLLGVDVTRALTKLFSEMLLC